jgi:uncharacterized membrane protein YedE/YeeE
MIRLVALACGLLCGAGFVISGLYDPALIHGVWQSDGAPFAIGLAIVAIVLVATLVTFLSPRRNVPLLGGEEEPLPVWTGWKPLLSALVFGLGWGVSGYFPMAALVSAGTASPGAAIFLVSVLFGMIVTDIISGKRKHGSGRKGSFG